MDYRRTFGMNINVPFNVGDVWNAAAVVNVFNHRKKADKYHDISFDNSKWIFMGHWTIPSVLAKAVRSHFLLTSHIFRHRYKDWPHYRAYGRLMQA